MNFTSNRLDTLGVGLPLDLDLRWQVLSKSRIALVKKSYRASKMSRTIVGRAVSIPSSNVRLNLSAHQGSTIAGQGAGGSTGGGIRRRSPPAGRGVVDHSLELGSLCHADSCAMCVRLIAASRRSLRRIASVVSLLPAHHRLARSSPDPKLRCSPADSCHGSIDSPVHHARAGATLDFTLRNIAATIVRANPAADVA